ncbi:MAG: DUF697 domain-containing protein [Kofleriaceae bacterium]|nr:DUF697 domain-containing protein [Kofleriaceae bacterium]
MADTSTPPRRNANPRDPLDELFLLVDRLPFVGSLRSDLGRLQTLLYQRRAARLLALGTARAPRTELANALLGKHALGAPPPADEWVHVVASGTQLDWREQRVELAPPPPDGVGLVRRAFGDARPDCVLLVLDADDALSAQALPLVIEDAARTLAVLAEDGEKRPPMIAVLSRRAGDDDARIEAARTALEKALHGASLQDVAVIPLSSRISWGPDGALREDAREHVDMLAEAIFEALPDAARIEAGRAFPAALEGRRRVAQVVVHAASAVALTVGLTPLPVADAFVLVPLQTLMVSSIAHLSGRPWRALAISEWMASLGVAGGVGFGLRWVAQQAVKLVPGAGSIISASVAAAGTAALGHSAIAYFVDGVSGREARKHLTPPKARPAD